MTQENNTSVVLYEDRYQADIDAFMNAIAQEFSITITPASVVPFNPDKYWIALHEGKAIGTIAACNMANNEVALRKMFLHKPFRGQGVSKMLLDAFISWAYETKRSTIYLGTMSVFKAAQRFYEKNGFEQIERSELPPEFIANPVDTIFYKRILLR